MTKTQAISAMILAGVANGKTISESFDAVIGEGAYVKFASELYDEIRRINGVD